MSDTLAIYINGDDTVGEYSNNNAIGIRRFPYTNYPNTYGDVTGTERPRRRRDLRGDDVAAAAAAGWRSGWHTQDQLSTTSSTA